MPVKRMHRRLARSLSFPYKLARLLRSMNDPLPDIRKLMAEVQEHQRKMDSLRETYTYTTFTTTQDIDSMAK